MSAHKRIETRLKAGRSITPLQALQLYGCFRLGSVINRLRKKYTIKTELVPNPKDPAHSYARYKMVRQEGSHA